LAGPCGKARRDFVEMYVGRFEVWGHEIPSQNPLRVAARQHEPAKPRAREEGTWRASQILPGTQFPLPPMARISVRLDRRLVDDWPRPMTFKENRVMKCAFVPLTPAGAKEISTMHAANDPVAVRGFPPPCGADALRHLATTGFTRGYIPQLLRSW